MEPPHGGKDGREATLGEMPGSGVSLKALAIQNNTRYSHGISLNGK